MNADVILWIDPSCDETAAIVVERARDVRSSVVASRMDGHAPGGSNDADDLARLSQEQHVS